MLHSGCVDGDLSTEAIVWCMSDRHNGLGAEPPAQTGGEMGERVLVMGPNVRTYLFHPLAQVIGCLSVWPRLKRRVMDGSFDRG